MVDSERSILTGGEKLRTHTRADCNAGLSTRACCIHHPSNHHMRKWKQHWRGDVGKMERICPHGIGHPDPDDLYPSKVHGCDGCCQPPPDEAA